MVETKRVKTKCTIPQLETGARLVEVGVDWRVWRPHDWPELEVVFTAGRLKLPRWPQGDVAEAREEKCSDCGQRVTAVYVRTVGGSWTLADGRCAPLCGGCLTNSETS